MVVLAILGFLGCLACLAYAWHLNENHKEERKEDSERFERIENRIIGLPNQMRQYDQEHPESSTSERVEFVKEYLASGGIEFGGAAETVATSDPPFIPKTGLADPNIIWAGEDEKKRGDEEEYQPPPDEDQ